MSLLTGHCRLGCAAVCLDSAHQSETTALFIEETQLTDHCDSLHGGRAEDEEVSCHLTLLLDLSELHIKVPPVATALPKFNYVLHMIMWVF